MMYTFTRMRALGAIVLALAVGAAGPSAAFGAHDAKKKARHCVKFKTVKSKKGKKIKRCAKYGK
jgi:hypothetical protein